MTAAVKLHKTRIRPGEGQQDSILPVWSSGAYSHESAGGTRPGLQCNVGGITVLPQGCRGHVLFSVSLSLRVA